MTFKDYVLAWVLMQLFFYGTLTAEVYNEILAETYDCSVYAEHVPPLVEGFFPITFYLRDTNFYMTNLESDYCYPSES